MDNHYEHYVILNNIQDLFLKYIQCCYPPQQKKKSNLLISSSFNHLKPQYGR